ncbi:MAG: DUF58 domain-containing protein [Candidatus Omnitrophota bacterium]
MLTKRAVFIFLFSLLLLLGAWISQLLWIYIAFSACMGIIILSYVLSRLLMFNLEIKRNAPAKVYEDDVVDITIQVRNKIALFDQSIEIQDNFTPASPGLRIKIFLLNGLPKGQSEFTYQEQCYKRGHYRLGPFKVRVTEPLGLFYHQKIIPVYSPLAVYPKIFPVYHVPFILGHLAPRFGEQTTRICGNYEEFFGIREYHKEDGWRRIHWRSTARYSQLMVRHFEQSSQWKAMVVLDANMLHNLGAGKDATFEYGVKIAASLIEHILYKQASFGLIASNKELLRIGMSKGQGHYYSLMDALAVIEADGSLQLPELITHYQSVIPASSSLIIITTTDAINQGLINMLHNLQLKKNIGIIPVIFNGASFEDHKKIDKQSNKFSSVKGILNRLSSEVYFINCRDDLKSHFMV